MSGKTSVAQRLIKHIEFNSHDDLEMNRLADSLTNRYGNDLVKVLESWIHTTDSVAAINAVSRLAEYTLFVKRRERMRNNSRL